MFKNKDINNYGEKKAKISTQTADDAFAVAAGQTAKSIGSMIWKLFLTIFTILVIAGIIVLFSVGSFIFSQRNSQIASLSSFKLNESSRVFVEDGEGGWKEYMSFHAVENRTWVDFADIPDNMKNAMTAIEDKRFYEHHGVDWRTTLGAVVKLATGRGGAGGSTITQQLIKNITNDKEVSISRKIREIFSALNLEKVYTKDEILEYYLNYVYYGSGCNGIQAAANLYFGKDIADCDIAECASIAGITQNPYAYTPVLFPENNKARQQIVLGEMYSQGYITKEEYDDAMDESEHMNWAFGASHMGEDSDEEEEDTSSIWNWYIENMYYDMIDEIAEAQNISRSLAVQKITNGGLRIYSCLNEQIQTDIEKIFNQRSFSLVSDSSIQFGYYMMDYEGKVLAVVGSRNTKNANLLTNRATQSTRSPGSSFKPVCVYGPALDAGLITYGTVLKDQGLEGYFDNGLPGPNNISGYFTGYMNTCDAIEVSQNAPAVQLGHQMSIPTCYQYLIDRFHFSTLDAVNDQYSLSMPIGGLYYGVTVRDMTAAYQTFGNGGNYYKPHTFYYIEDNDGKVIVDNRNLVPTRSLSSENATIMNKWLQNVIYGYNGTGYQTRIDGWTIYGKTGTTDDFSDIWFVGGTPICVAGCWAGYDLPSTLPTSDAAKTMWKACMEYMVYNYGYLYPSDFTYDENVTQMLYCRDSGLMASSSCYNVAWGWYDVNNTPPYCNAGSDHTRYNRDITYSVTATPTPAPNVNYDDNGWDDTTYEPEYNYDNNDNYDDGGWDNNDDEYYGGDDNYDDGGWYDDGYYDDGNYDDGGYDDTDWGDYGNYDDGGDVFDFGGDDTYFE